MDKLKEAIAEKRPELVNRKGVLFHQVNLTHVFDYPGNDITTRLKCFITTYSPDIASSDCYSFRSLQNFLNGKGLHTFLEDCKNHFQQFFTEKTPSPTHEKLCNCPKDSKRLQKTSAITLLIEIVFKYK